MWDIKKMFTARVSDVDQKAGNKRLRVERIPVLENSEIKKRRAKIRKQLGLDEHLQPIKTIPQDIEGAPGNSDYYREVLGNQSLNWDEVFELGRDL